MLKYKKMNKSAHLTIAYYTIMNSFGPIPGTTLTNNIRVRMFGGLGNQLFQYYAAKSVSIKLNLPLVMDFSWLSKYNVHSNSDIRDFKFIQNELIDYSTNSGSFIKERIKNRVVRKYKTFGPIFRIDIPNTTGYTDLGHVKGGMELRGYYQSYKYFEQFCKIQSAPDWTLTNESVKYQRYRDKLVAQDFISMHIRGGDYLNSNSPYVNLDEEYYISALNEIKKTTGNLKTYIFTNDVDHGRNFLKLGTNLEIISTQDLNASENLKIMSLGKGLVLSNSTFAYWAGIISNASNIVVPKKWFKKINIGNDLYPANWETIN
jgi:hypothetical protein